MASQHPSFCRTRSVIASAVVVVAVVSAACGRATGPAPGAGGPPPTAVKISTLSPTPIDDASEFIATLRSLRSTTIQPDVEGLITQIFVKSGQRVSVGAPLVQINPAKQQASVSSAEANRTGTEADVTYWRAQTKRLESLVEAGAISKAEFDQAQNSLRYGRGAPRGTRRTGARGARGARVLPRRGTAGGHNR